MKNKKILGMPLAVFIIGLMVIGGASAVLVGFLSNETTAEITVESPIQLQLAEVEHGMTIPTTIDNVADGSVVWSDDISLSSTALSKEELGLKVEVIANQDIAGKNLELMLSNNNNDASCLDLTSLTFIDVGCSAGTACYQVEQELVGVAPCTDNSDGSVSYMIPITLFEVGETYKYPVTLTFANVNPDVYNFDAQVMN